MNNYYITIFTATYNREHTLNVLYNSLLNQTYKNFEWLIIDDGSTDDTKKFIDKIKLENKLKIEYHFKVNGGKHRAINYGVNIAKGDFFFIVDSDDRLPENSIEKIIQLTQNLDLNLAGIVGRKTYFNGRNIGSEFPKNKFISNHIEKSNELGLSGDLAEVVKTEVLKLYAFPDFQGEIFSSESLVWNRISRNYNYLFVNTSLYFAEYLSEGLSYYSVENRRLSPNYATLIYKESFLLDTLSFFKKIKVLSNYWRFSFFNGQSLIKNWESINYSFMSIISLPIGFLLKHRDDFIVRKLK